MNGPLGNVAQEMLERHQAGGAAEDVVADLGLDVDHQFFENLERLRFVFDQRIALAISAQADCCCAGCPWRRDVPATIYRSR